MRPIAREIAVVAIFTVAAAVVMTWPLLPQARTHIIDFGLDDTLLYTRYARCFRDWLIGREHGYLNFDMYFPSLLSGATDDAALGIAVQALPLAIFIRDYLFTINLITFASFVMCAHATYLLTRQLTLSRGAGIVAGSGVCVLFLPHAGSSTTRTCCRCSGLPYALYLHASTCRCADQAQTEYRRLRAVSLFLRCTASFNVAIYSSLVFSDPSGAWLTLTTAKKSAFAPRRKPLIVSVRARRAYPCFTSSIGHSLILRDAGAPVRDSVRDLLVLVDRFRDFWQTPQHRVFEKLRRPREVRDRPECASCSSAGRCWGSRRWACIRDCRPRIGDAARFGIVKKSDGHTSSSGSARAGAFAIALLGRFIFLAFLRIDRRLSAADSFRLWRSRCSRILTVTVATIPCRIASRELAVVSAGLCSSRDRPRLCGSVVSDPIS